MTNVYKDDLTTIIHGDCIEAMRELPDDSIDAIVTDPPYGLGFMGKDWDALPPGLPWAQECLRVLKPGGHLLAFGGTRTWHRLAVAVEDAGFEIRDSIAWLYGSGFPKSLDVSKAIDKAAGATREVTGYRVKTNNTVSSRQHLGVDAEGRTADNRDAATAAAYQALGGFDLTAPATPEAEQWQGFGTSLKPAFEPVVVGRKPFKGNVAANVLAYGTGALNIDGCRIEGVKGVPASPRVKPGGEPNGGVFGHYPTPSGDSAGWDPHAGRWPTNVILDESQAAALDEQGGGTSYNPAGKFGENKRDDNNNGIYGGGKGITKKGLQVFGYGDRGGASRFFYCAKAPKKERPTADDGTAHPTVKPLTLMRWLVRLVTPPGGVVLDPFAGSGTTVEAALQEGFRVVGIEREADYLPLIEARIRRTFVNPSEPAEPVQDFIDFGESA